MWAGGIQGSTGRRGGHGPGSPEVHGDEMGEVWLGEPGVHGEEGTGMGRGHPGIHGEEGTGMGRGAQGSMETRGDGRGPEKPGVHGDSGDREEGTGVVRGNPVACLVIRAAWSRDQTSSAGQGEGSG